MRFSVYELDLNCQWSETESFVDHDEGMIGLKIRSHLNEANKNPFTCLVGSRLTLIDCCLDLKYRSKLRECCFEISL